MPAYALALEAAAEPPPRIPAKGGREEDGISGWRRVVCWTQRAGACRYAKRSYNRRLRRMARRILGQAAA